MLTWFKHVNNFINCIGTTYGSGDTVVKAKERFTWAPDWLALLLHTLANVPLLWEISAPNWGSTIAASINETKSSNDGFSTFQRTMKAYQVFENTLQLTDSKVSLAIAAMQSGKPIDGHESSFHFLDMIDLTHGPFTSLLMIYFILGDLTEVQVKYYEHACSELDRQFNAGEITIQVNATDYKPILPQPQTEVTQQRLAELSSTYLDLFVNGK